MYGVWGDRSTDLWNNRDGALTFVDEIECPICLETAAGVVQPKCQHALCVECFRRCWNGDESRTGEPVFPYPDFEDEYYDQPIGQENPIWEADPLIIEFHRAWNEWDDQREDKYENEKNLRVCPICGK